MSGVRGVLAVFGLIMGAMGCDAEAEDRPEVLRVATEELEDAVAAGTIPGAGRSAPRGADEAPSELSLNLEAPRWPAGEEAPGELLSEPEIQAAPNCHWAADYYCCNWSDCLTCTEQQDGCTAWACDDGDEGYGCPGGA